MDEELLALALPAVTDPRRDNDPARLGWPPALPLELALRTHTPAQLCAGYGITEDEWNKMRADPTFQSAVARYVELIKEEGMTFKLKAQLQSEALLEESWRLIHSPDTPANVRADLIKYTWKCAGHEPKSGGVEGVGNAFQININL